MQARRMTKAAMHFMRDAFTFMILIRKSVKIKSPCTLTNAGGFGMRQVLHQRIYFIMTSKWTLLLAFASFEFLFFFVGISGTASLVSP
jgi:hypothetical protein